VDIPLKLDEESKPEEVAKAGRKSKKIEVPLRLEEEPEEMDKSG
jgi:hypothetical protein